MDGDRAMAARKLPQTSANFFVGTNSRVPRMTLAQSSHIIPIPTSTTQAFQPSSKVVLNRLRNSPFLDSPASAKSVSFPRSAFSEGGKAAKAAQFFAALADDSTPTSHDPTEAAPTLPPPEGRHLRSPIADGNLGSVPTTMPTNGNEALCAAAQNEGASHRMYTPDVGRAPSSRRLALLESTSEKYQQPVSLGTPLSPPKSSAIKPASSLASDAHGRNVTERAPSYGLKLRRKKSKPSPPTSASDRAPMSEAASTQAGSKAQAVQGVDDGVISGTAGMVPLVALKSAFSDPSTRSGTPHLTRFALRQATSDSHHQDVTIIDQSSRLLDTPASPSMHDVTPDRVGRRYEAPPVPSAPRMLSPASAYPGYGAEDLIDCFLQGCSESFDGIDQPLQEGVWSPTHPGTEADMNTARSNSPHDAVSGDHETDKDWTREDDATIPYEASVSGSLAPSTELARVPTHQDHEKGVLVQASDANTPSSSLQDIRMGPICSRSIGETSELQNSRRPRSGELHANLSWPSPSVTEEDVLFAMIDEVAMPASEFDYSEPHDSLFERTATWIQSTMAQDEMETLVDPVIGHVDEGAVVDAIATESTGRVTCPDTSLSAGTSPASRFATYRQKAYKMPKEAGFATPKQSDGPVVDIGATREGAPDVSRSRRRRSDMVSIGSSSRRKTRSPKTVRTFSQRARTQTKPSQRVKQAPGRLKIPALRSESKERQRRQSLELLPRRSSRKLSASQATSRELATETSRQEAATEGSRKVQDKLGLWGHSADTETTPIKSAEPGKHRVGQAIKDWNENGSSEDEEVASVIVGKRMTLSRLSLLADKPNPQREARPLPGRLAQGSRKSELAQDSEELNRPVRRLRPAQDIDLSEQMIKPSMRQAKTVARATSMQEHDVYDVKDASMARREPARLAQRAKPIEEGMEPITKGPSATTRDMVGPRKSLQLWTNPPSPARFGLGAALCGTVSAHTPPRVGTVLLKPLRLPSATIPSTVTSRPNASISTSNPSPHTIISDVGIPVQRHINSSTSAPSDIWSTNQSHLVNSALTDETRVNTPAGTQSELATQNRSTGLKSSDPEPDHSANRERPDGPDHSSCASGHGQPHYLGRSDRQVSDVVVATERSPSRHQSTFQPRSGVHSSAFRHTTTIGGPSSPARSHVDADHSFVMPMQTSETPGLGFEIGFSLQEPRTAPHVQEGALMEFGFRVHIKPIGGDQSQGTWRLVPPLPPRIDPTSRRSPHIEPDQFEYNHLTTAQMGKVQEEAQEHLLQAIASEQRNRHLASDASSPSTPSRQCNDRPRSLLSTTEAAEAHTPKSTSRAYREMLLPRTRQPSVSHSTTESSNLTLADSVSPLRRRTPSTALTSPLPYIKRAPPRQASSVVAPS